MTHIRFAVTHYCNPIGQETASSEAQALSPTGWEHFATFVHPISWKPALAGVRTYAGKRLDNKKSQWIMGLNFIKSEPGLCLYYY